MHVLEKVGEGVEVLDLPRDVSHSTLSCDPGKTSSLHRGPLYDKLICSYNRMKKMGNSDLRKENGTSSIYEVDEIRPQLEIVSVLREKPLPIDSMNHIGGVGRSF